ncbi:MAG: hypothetical protein LBC14_01155 [Desulfovibrio sp.]|jgi:hypothetical protein|nr:hypothetical protein [Desulfovibrio sp.]
MTVGEKGTGPGILALFTEEREMDARERFVTLGRKTGLFMPSDQWGYRTILTPEFYAVDGATFLLR